MHKHTTTKVAKLTFEDLMHRVFLYFIAPTGVLGMFFADSMDAGPGMKQISAFTMLCDHIDAINWSSPASILNLVLAALLLLALLCGITAYNAWSKALSSSTTPRNDIPAFTPMSMPGAWPDNMEDCDRAGIPRPPPLPPARSPAPRSFPLKLALTPFLPRHPVLRRTGNSLKKYSWEHKPVPTRKLTLEDYARIAKEKAYWEGVRAKALEEDAREEAERVAKEAALKRARDEAEEEARRIADEAVEAEFQAEMAAEAAAQAAAKVAAEEQRRVTEAAAEAERRAAEEKLEAARRAQEAELEATRQAAEEAAKRFEEEMLKEEDAKREAAAIAARESPFVITEKDLEEARLAKEQMSHDSYFDDSDDDAPAIDNKTSQGRPKDELEQAWEAALQMPHDPDFDELDDLADPTPVLHNTATSHMPRAPQAPIDGSFLKPAREIFKDWIESRKEPQQPVVFLPVQEIFRRYIESKKQSQQQPILLSEHDIFRSRTQSQSYNQISYTTQLGLDWDGDVVMDDIGHHSAPARLESGWTPMTPLFEKDGDIRMGEATPCPPRRNREPPSEAPRAPRCTRPAGTRPPTSFAIAGF